MLGYKSIPHHPTSYSICFLFLDQRGTASQPFPTGASSRLMSRLVGDPRPVVTTAHSKRPRAWLQRGLWGVKGTRVHGRKLEFTGGTQTWWNDPLFGVIGPQMEMKMEMSSRTGRLLNGTFMDGNDHGSAVHHLFEENGKGPFHPCTWWFQGRVKKDGIWLYLVQYLVVPGTVPTLFVTVLCSESKCYRFCQQHNLGRVLHLLHFCHGCLSFPIEHVRCGRFLHLRESVYLRVLV